MAERPDTPSVRGGHSLQSTSRIVINVFQEKGKQSRQKAQFFLTAVQSSAKASGTEKTWIAAWIAGKKRFKEMDWETAHLIKTLTGAKFPFKQKGGVVNMWEGWEMSIKQASDNAYDNGYDSGYDNAKFEYLQNLMENTGWDARQAMKALSLSEHDQDVYIKRLAERTKQTPSGKGC